MIFKTHPYLFASTFDDNLVFIFFSESGEFDDGFAYPIRAQIVPMVFENSEEDDIGSVRKWELLTFLSNINIILSYRHGKWLKDDINDYIKTKGRIRVKIFWNRDKIQVLEDLGEGSQAIDRLILKKDEILKRLKISQEEYTKYLPLAKEYIEHIKKRQIEDDMHPYEEFYDLELSRHLLPFYIYDENGHLFTRKYLKNKNYLEILFQERWKYPTFDEWAKYSEWYGIPQRLILEKYIQYANKYTLPEDEHLKAEAFKRIMDMGLL
ncbi:MAG: hypothetical protein JHC31_04545 [Sulfurihydrogenibium sp.]|jgi:hypothetical protein|nr:hypothetical protein [Sulfurihydrogenibium sp.]